MAKRDLEEINASSMADIAFLLLVFFLVTTTFNKELAVSERLPQKIRGPQPEVIVNPVNVLQIVANRNNDILLQNDYGTIDEIPDLVRTFYSHDKSLDNTKWPATTYIDKAKIDFEVARQKEKGLEQNDSIGIWEKKYAIVERVGPYKEISSKAIITITVDNSTKFETYLMVYDAVLRGINSLRNDLAIEKFNRPYNSFNPKITEESDIIDAINAVYPKRIMKAKNLASE